MSRPDISPYLIHFTSGDSQESAFARLKAIVAERRLVGVGSKIRGGYGCICFTEAPPWSLSGGFVNERFCSRYSSFGVLVWKKWLFSLGGRPAIYQTEEEYLCLPESHRWRHMRYDLREGMEQVDFSWEREWRIRADVLEFDPSVARLVLPEGTWAKTLISDHDRGADYEVMQYAQIFDNEQVAEMHRDTFQWQIVVLTGKA